jgi:hypothetical protein
VVTPTTESGDDDDSALLGSRIDRQYRDKPFIEALVYGVYNGAPALSFYTSEVQVDTDMTWQHWAEDESESDVLGVVFGGTKAIVGGMVGLGIGALRWTLGGSTKTPDPSRSFDETRSDEEANQEYQDLSMEVDISASPFPSLWREPLTLYPGYDFPDPPRQVESCSVDPDGRLAAMTDSLGRILLFDLSAKQMVRMWKGYRDSSCSWIHDHRFQGVRSTSLRLVIHSRQRRVLDIWCVPHGPRVSSIQVERGTEVFSSPIGPPVSQMATSYLVHSRTLGSSLNKLKEIMIDDAGSVDPQFSISAAKTPVNASLREATFKLQHLRQLLSSPTARLDANDVYDALRSITSLKDLSTSLDLLSEATLLEEKLGVSGSAFQKLAVSLCNEALVASIKGGTSQELETNPNVAALSRKIEYHRQVSNRAGLVLLSLSVIALKIA